MGTTTRPGGSSARVNMFGLFSGEGGGDGRRPGMAPSPYADRQAARAHGLQRATGASDSSSRGSANSGRERRNGPRIPTPPQLLKKDRKVAGGRNAASGAGLESNANERASSTRASASRASATRASTGSRNHAYPRRPPSRGRRFDFDDDRSSFMEMARGWASNVRSSQTRGVAKKQDSSSRRRANLMNGTNDNTNVQNRSSSRASASQAPRDSSVTQTHVEYNSSSAKSGGLRSSTTRMDASGSSVAVGNISGEKENVKRQVPQERRSSFLNAFTRSLTRSSSHISSSLEKTPPPASQVTKLSDAIPDKEEFVSSENVGSAIHSDESSLLSNGFRSRGSSEQNSSAQRGEMRGSLRNYSRRFASFFSRSESLVEETVTPVGSAVPSSSLNSADSDVQTAREAGKNAEGKVAAETNKAGATVAIAPIAEGAGKDEDRAETVASKAETTQTMTRSPKTNRASSSVTHNTSNVSRRTPEVRRASFNAIADALRGRKRSVDVGTTDAVMADGQKSSSTQHRDRPFPMSSPAKDTNAMMVGTDDAMRKNTSLPSVSLNRKKSEDLSSQEASPTRRSLTNFFGIGNSPKTSPTRNATASTSSPSKSAQMQVPDGANATKTTPTKSTPAPKPSPIKRTPSPKRTPTKGSTATKTTPAKGITATKTTPTKGTTATKTTPTKGTTATKTTPTKGTTATTKTTPTKGTTATTKTTPTKGTTATQTTPTKGTTATKTTPPRRSPKNKTAVVGKKLPEMELPPTVSEIEPAEIVEDENKLFADEKSDDDEASFVSAKCDDREQELDDLELCDRWSDRVPFTELGPRASVTSVDLSSDAGASTTDTEGEDEEDEDEDEENNGEEDEGRVLSASELEKIRQQKEDEQVEKVLRKLSKASMGSGRSTPQRAAPRDSNIDSSKKLDISTIEARRSSGVESSLVSKYRERRSQSVEGGIKRKSSYNLKASSTARLLANGLHGDLDETTIMFGGADAMLDYLEDSETDQTAYTDPVKRSMKFAACRAIIGDLLEDSNVYSTARLAKEEQEA